MIDGRLVPAGDVPRVALDDGLVRGDGVFEGIRLYDRRPRTPGWHLDRLARSAETIGLGLDRALIEEELAAFCRATTAADCAVRLIVTRGGQRVWREEPIPPGGPGGRAPAAGRPPRDAAPGRRQDPVVRGQHGGGPPRPRRPAATRPCSWTPIAAWCWRGRPGRWAGSTATRWSSRRSSSGSSTPSPAAWPARRSRCARRRPGSTSWRAPTGRLALSTLTEARPVAEVRGVASYDPASPRVLAAAAAIREAIAAAIP